MKIKKIMLVSFLVAMITACGDNQKENKTESKQETTSAVKVEKLSPVPDVSEQNKDVKKEPVVEKQEVKDNKVSEEQKITQVEENKKEASEIINQNNWGSGDVEKDTKFLKTYNFKVSDEQTEKTLINVLDDYKAFNLIKSELDTNETLSKIWRPAKK